MAGYFYWLRGGPTLVFSSKLDLDTFREKFRDRIKSPGAKQELTGLLLGLDGTSEFNVKGSIKGDSFSVRRRIYHRSDAQPSFSGRLTAEDQSTRVEGIFGVNPIVAAFMLVFFLVSFSLSVMAFVGLLGTGNYLSLLVSIGVIAALILAAMFTKVTGRKQEQYFINFFQDALDAKLIDRRD